MAKAISENDSLVLMDERGNKILLIVKNEMEKIKGLGVYNPGELIDKIYGEKITIGNRTFVILSPSISDKLSAIERRAQIILPKDGMHIIFHCDIASGDRVVEGGAGSGALSLLLAHFVRPKGKVISYEKRDEFAQVARRNVRNAGLLDHVDFKKGDVTEAIVENDVDAVVLDIPNPWDAVQNALHALKLGGHLASYSPTMNQVQRTQIEMRNHGFIEILTLETLQREIVVGERGVRPSFDMLGHTGYVTFGRKISNGI